MFMAVVVTLNFMIGITVTLSPKEFFMSSYDSQQVPLLPLQPGIPRDDLECRCAEYVGARKILLKFNCLRLASNS